MIAPPPPTLLTPHRSDNSVNYVKWAKPLTTYLNPLYPKFLEATPKLRLVNEVNLLSKFPIALPPSLLI